MNRTTKSNSSILFIDILKTSFVFSFVIWLVVYHVNYTQHTNAVHQDITKIYIDTYMVQSDVANLDNITQPFGNNSVGVFAGAFAGGTFGAGINLADPPLVPSPMTFFVGYNDAGFFNPANVTRLTIPFAGNYVGATTNTVVIGKWSGGGPPTGTYTLRVKQTLVVYSPDSVVKNTDCYIEQEENENDIYDTTDLIHRLGGLYCDFGYLNMGDFIRLEFLFTFTGDAEGKTLAANQVYNFPTVLRRLPELV